MHSLCQLPSRRAQRSNFPASSRWIVLAVSLLVSMPAAISQQITVGGVSWHTDYSTAYHQAKQQQRMLLINFLPSDHNETQQSVEQAIADREQLQSQLDEVVLCRVSLDSELEVAGRERRLVDCEGFRELKGGAGFALVDLANPDASHYRDVVSVLPYASGKYYRWNIEGLAETLDLPPGSLSQRTMIWAVRMHPEAPQSTTGHFHGELATGAAAHSSYQAKVKQQGHQNFSSRSQRLGAIAGGSVSEVCAESWPGQSLIDSCIDCVASWRHSSGHWRGVSRPHRAYGYDIRRGGNGIWYGTGIFVD